SPAKQGELANLNKYGPSLVQGIASGILQSRSTLHGAMAQLTSGLGVQAVVGSASGRFTGIAGNTGVGVSPVSVSPSRGEHTIVIHNHHHLYVDGHEMSRAMIDHLGPMI